MAPPRKAGRGGVSLSFLEDLFCARRAVVVTGREGEGMDLGAGLGAALELMEKACGRGRKLMFIGNGGSAAMASHLAVDFWKNGGLSALAFNDSAQLTCLSNDYGYERVFAEPIGRFAQSGDVLVAISSSGRSPNILRGVEAARKVGCGVVTLSGFDESNELRRTGDLNFYAPSHSYGVVEITHLSLLHAVLEESILARAKVKGGGQ